MDFLTIFTAAHGMSLGLLVGLILIVWVLWSLNKDTSNTFDIKDLVCIDGKIDERKFERFGAWIVSTWGFVYLIVDSRFSEYYFTGYMGVWVSSALISKFLDSKKSA